MHERGSACLDVVPEEAEVAIEEKPCEGAQVEKTKAEAPEGPPELTVAEESKPKEQEERRPRRFTLPQPSRKNSSVSSSSSVARSPLVFDPAGRYRGSTTDSVMSPTPASTP